MDQGMMVSLINLNWMSRLPIQNLKIHLIGPETLTGDMRL